MFVSATNTTQLPPKLSSLSVSLLAARQSRTLRKLLRILGTSTGLFFAYVLGGAAIFCACEGWSFVDSLYFATVTITTVGYGDMAPLQPYSKVVNVFYIFFGVGLAAGEFTAMLAGLQHLAMQRFQLTVASGAEVKAPTGTHWIILTWLCFFVSIQCICAIPYTLVPIDVAETAVNESSSFTLLYGDAVYHGWVTASTVGYGVTPLATVAWFRLYVIFHLLLSTSMLAGLFGMLSGRKGRLEAEQQWADVLSIKLTEQLIDQLDRDGDGVDKIEFLVGMLAKLELAYWHDIKPLLHLFDSMDRDGSGVLTKADLLMSENVSDEKIPKSKRRVPPTEMTQRHSFTEPRSLTRGISSRSTGTRAVEGKGSEQCSESWGTFGFRPVTGAGTSLVEDALASTGLLAVGEEKSWTGAKSTKRTIAKDSVHAISLQRALREDAEEARMAKEDARDALEAKEAVVEAGQVVVAATRAASKTIGAAAGGVAGGLGYLSRQLPAVTEAGTALVRTPTGATGVGSARPTQREATPRKGHPPPTPMYYL